MNMLDHIADRLAFEDLKRNPKSLTLRSLGSLGLLFAPGVGFIGALWLLKNTHARFEWVNHLAEYPWQFWGIALCGTIATIGGVGDWVFHKVYVTVGPHEHHSHLLALGAGGIVFVLMAIASIIDQPLHMLIPMMIALSLTITLICYDEFAFHIKRCKPFETLLHRMLVFGNGLAFLCWVHWLFVLGGHHG